MTPWEHLAQKMINSNAIFQSGLQKDQSGVTVRYNNNDNDTDNENSNVSLEK